MTALTITPIARASGTVRLPGSKSLSNRALLLSALASGTTALSNLLHADDTRVMIDALRALGIAVSRTADGAEIAGGAGAFPARSADLFLGNAGTAMRPLAAALAFAGGRYRLDGVARMRERPIGDLVDALNGLGARIRYEATPGYPPLVVEPAELRGAGRVEVKGGVSSQFVSGLLMAAPLLAPSSGAESSSGDGIEIHVPGPLVSQPYVEMTIAVMRRFGVTVERRDGRGGAAFFVPRGMYRSPGHFAVEGDASGASYFLALGALAGGPVRVLGVGRDSVQGDVAFASVLAEMGARVDSGPDWLEVRSGDRLTALDRDCSAIPDAAMTAAVLALFAGGRSVLRGIGSWRVKETDRIAAMAAELAKLGARVETGPDWLAVTPPGQIREAIIDTYDDHRVAMCFALAACGGVPVHLRDPGCVAKTFPTYFDDLAGLVAHPAVAG